MSLDFSAFDREFPDAFDPYATNEQIVALAAALAAVRFDVHNPPPHAPAIYTLGDAKIATAGNLVGIQAQAKAGKSALIGAMIASTMEPTGDVLGFVSENPQGLALIHFDTEQSRADHDSLIRRALKRAGRAVPPPWLRSYCVTGLTLKDRKAVLSFELERAYSECGGFIPFFWTALQTSPQTRTKLAKHLR